VTENHRVGDDEGADATFDPVVDVRTADTGVVYGDEDIAGVFDGWTWLFFKLDIEGLVEVEGKILSCDVS